MSTKSPRILSLAAALSALTGMTAVAPGPAEAKPIGPQESIAPDTTMPASDLTPNQILSVGKDFLGFIVTDTADGTVLAQHYSHTSHASHASHASHYSGR
jgi:hypothetical protein